MASINISTELTQASAPQKIEYSSRTKAAIAAILLAGSSAMVSAADTNSNSSSESDMGNTTELILEIGSTIGLCALACYYATQRPRHGR